MILNRQFRKIVSAFLMLFVLLATIQVPVSQAADSQIAKLITESNTVNAGNTTDFTLGVSGVTQSVYQQVYGSHAVITFDPAVLEYVSAAAANNKLQVVTDTSSASNGQVAVTTSLTNSSQPLSISVADSSLVKLTFKPKAVSQASAASVAASQISIVNGQGNSLLFQDVSTSLTVLPAGNTTNPGSELPDGEYKIGYTIYKKNSNEPSVMYDYVDRDSGKLTVQGGKKYVSLTLKQSAEILSFKTEKNGALVETTTVSNDATANTRVVRFEVDDLSARLNGWVKIYWMLPPPLGLYDHEYEVQIGFDPVALEYDMNYTSLHATEDKPSSMERYFVKPGKLKIRQGQKLMSFTITSSSLIPSFKVEQNGTLVETTVVSTNKADNTRVIEFPVNDLTQLLKARVHISTTMPNGTPYEMDHDIRLKFDVGTRTALYTLIADAQSKHDTAVEGTAIGQYPAGSKGTLLSAIQQAKAVAGYIAATQSQIDQAVTDLQAALNIFTASVISSNGTGTWPDGEYNAKFMIHKKGTAELSVMMDYVDKDSGKVTVKGGKKYVSLKLNKSAEIVSFKTKQNGSLVETKTVSSDIAANTRVVEFEVSELTAKLDGWVKIYWVLPEPIGIYDHEYDVDLAFSDFTVDLSKTIPDGQYSFSYTVSSEEAGANFNAYAEPTGALKVQSGKKLATLKLKNGATVTKIQQLMTDGSKQDVVTQYASKQAGIVRVLTSDSSTKEVQFEVNDVNGVYLIDLKAGDGSAHTFKLSLNKVSPTGTVDPSNPPSGGGNTGGNTGGGSGGGGGGGGVVTNPNALADGKYTMNFTIKKYGTDERSVMQDYVITPGILTVEGGKQYFSLTLKQSKEITDFKTEVGGSLVDTEVLNRDEAKNTRDVQFEVADLSSRLKGWVKVDWKEFNYFHNYDIDITFDKSSAKKVSATTTLGGGGSVVASLKDGEYDLDFKVLQYRNNLESAMNEYISHPGKLIVKDGKREVALTLNNHSKMTDFKVEKEKMIEATEYEAAKKEIIMESATVASTNEEANQRVVTFEVKDFTKATHAQVEMSEMDEEAAAKQAEAQAQAKQNQSEEEDGYINTQPPMKKELIDVDIMFDIDALGKKPGEEETEELPSTEQPTAPGEQPAVLKDIQDHWAKTLIERAVSLGIVKGYEDGTFHPDNEVSRAEFTAMIGRALKLEGQKGELNFADADRIPSWVKPTITQAVHEGIISSYEDQTFRAERKITRSEIAVMITRALKLSNDSTAALPFADAEEVPQWARAQVAAAVELGMINGRENNRFAPNASATRAEAVTLILAMLSNVKK